MHAIHILIKDLIHKLTDSYDDEAQPMDYDSFFKTESKLQYDNTSNMTENEQINQNTPNANVNRNLKINK